jgi:putative ATPase
LLPYAESGLITFIGATTENPSFEVNSALLSRAQVYVLKSLTDDELRQLLERARAEVIHDLVFDEPAIQILIGYADGDARRFLNLLEQIASAASASGKTQIDAEFLQNAPQQPPF